MRAALLALLLAGCGDSDIICRQWVVKEEVISIRPYMAGPVKRCLAWGVRGTDENGVVQK